MSKDKEGILALAKNGVEIQRPEDIIKDTYTLEFLDLPEEDRYTESDLEQWDSKRIKCYSDRPKMTSRFFDEKIYQIWREELLPI